MESAESCGPPPPSFSTRSWGAPRHVRRSQGRALHLGVSSCWWIPGRGQKRSTLKTVYWTDHKPRNE
eukprot:4297340-Alexandrium_andersonii.AAC.1